MSVLVADPWGLQMSKRRLRRVGVCDLVAAFCAWLCIDQSNLRPEKGSSVAESAESGMALLSMQRSYRQHRPVESNSFKNEAFEQRPASACKWHKAPTASMNAYPRLPSR